MIGLYVAFSDEPRGGDFIFPLSTISLVAAVRFLFLVLISRTCEALPTVKFELLWGTLARVLEAVGKSFL